MLARAQLCLAIKEAMHVTEQFLVRITGFYEPISTACFPRMYISMPYVMKNVLLMPVHDQGAVGDYGEHHGKATAVNQNGYVFDGDCKHLNIN